MQKPAIKPRTWALSPSPRAGHAWMSGVKSIAVSSHCSDSASITKVSYLADIDQLLLHVERNRGHPSWRVPQVPRSLALGSVALLVFEALLVFDMTERCS